MSPLEQDGVELPGAEVLITVLVKECVDHIDHMGIQLLIIKYVIRCHHYIAIDVCLHILIQNIYLVADPGSDLGELFPVDAAALCVQVEHCPLQVRAPKQHVVEVLEGGE